MEVTFLYEVGDIVMLRPMSGSDTDYTASIKSYDGKVTATQFRITQRRYVEEINGVGKIGYSGAVVGEIDKKVTLEEPAIIKVDEYLTKKAIMDSTKPKKSTPLRAAQATQVISPAVISQFQQIYGSTGTIPTSTGVPGFGLAPLKVEGTTPE